MIHRNTMKNIDQFNKRFDLFLSKHILNKDNQLSKAIHYSIFSGGKRFRPFLISVMSKELGLPSNITMHLSTSVEMLHNYSLVHDDLPAMDNDKYRRGKKTTHYKYNEFIAILAGCGLLTQSFGILSNKSFKVRDKVKSSLIAELCHISGEFGLLKGQYDDLSLKKYDMKRRLEINKLKTGMLMSYCCHCTAIAAGKNVKYQNKIKKLGMFIGEIFQINDDFEDFPKMKISDKKIYNEYKKKLYQKSYIIMKDLKFRKKETYQLLDFVFDLKV
tara:strand:+ start:1491 stop:2309 length:819 start_codon:yes stop_codon:yes gene_type:complete